MVDKKKVEEVVNKVKENAEKAINNGKEKAQETFKNIGDTAKETNIDNDFIKEKGSLIGAIGGVILIIVIYLIYSHFANSPKNLAGCNADVPVKNVKELLYPNLVASTKLTAGYSKNPYLAGMFFTDQDRNNIKYLQKWLEEDKEDAIKLDDFMTLRGDDDKGIYDCQAAIYVKYGEDGDYQKIGMVHYGNKLTDDKKKVYTTLYESGTDYNILRK